MRTAFPQFYRVVPKEAKRVFKGVIYDVYQWQQELFDGTMRTYEMLKRPDTVKVIVIEDDKILAIMDEQPSRIPMLTVPGGRHDVEHETELACAKRELGEETGIVCKNWKLVAVTQPSSKIEQFIYVFIASDIEHQGNAHADAGGEKITMEWLTYDQAMAKNDLPTTYWPDGLLRRAGSLNGLQQLPAYH